MDRARRRWRWALTALAGVVALGFLVRAGNAWQAGDAAGAAARLALACAFAAGLLGGRLMEGLRHAPRPAGRSLWSRRRS